MPYVAILLTMNSATLNHSKFLMSYLHKTETVNEKIVIHAITVLKLNWVNSVKLMEAIFGSA